MQRGITIRVLSKDIKVYPVLNLNKQVVKPLSMHMNIYNFVKTNYERKNDISGRSQVSLLILCTLLPSAPRITVVSWALCQALLVPLPVKIPHVPHVQSIIGGGKVLVEVQR